MSVGQYDPDEEESRFNKRPANQVPKTDLAIKVLACCGRKYFSGKPEATRWKRLEEKTIGLNEGNIMFKAWIEYHAEWILKKNQERIAITFPNLMQILENDIKRKDWCARNLKRVMDERINSIPDVVRKSKFQIESEEEHGRNSS